MATEVKIKIRAFPYYEDVEDPVTGEDRKVEKIAKRGDVVELSDVDLERAKRFNAIADDVEEDVTPPNQQLGVAPPLSEMSVEQLADWLQGGFEDQEGKPTIDDVVEAVDDDEELAAEMLEAENLATGNQPRAGLVERLEKITG